MTIKMMKLEYRVPGKLYCWTCTREIDENTNEWYMHRAGDGPLAHPRCETCNDVLMRYPQPNVEEKLERVDLYLSEVTKWTGISTVDDLTDEQRAMVEQVAELAGKARKLRSDLRMRELSAAHPVSEHNHEPVDVTQMPVTGCPYCAELTRVADAAGRKAAREILANPQVTDTSP